MFASPCLHGVLVSSAVNLPSAINSSSISHRPGFLAVLCPRSLINESTSFCIPVLAWLGAGEYERQRAGQREVDLTWQHLRPRQRVYRLAGRHSTRTYRTHHACRRASQHSRWTLDYRAAFCCHIILARRWFSAHTLFLLLFTIILPDIYLSHRP